MSLEQAKKRFKICKDAEDEYRDLMIDDLRFVKGGEEQWPVDQRKDRTGSQYKRPMLTINRTRQFVKRITGDIRQNSPQIKLSPVEESDDDITEIFEGIIRHIEESSSAKTAYNTAVDFAVKAGYGCWTVETDYADDDSFLQDIFIKRKRNPFTVYIDPNAEEMCKQDMMYAFESEWVPKEDIEKRYPDKTITDFGDAQQGENWEMYYSDGKVRLMRYWEKVPYNKTLKQLENGQVVCLDDRPEFVDVPGDIRTVRSHKVRWSIMTGSEVLQEGDWPGKYIPIVPLYGEEENVEGRTEYKGIVRDLQDPARMYNYWRTTAIETLALQPKAPWQATPKQMDGFEKFYQVANKANLDVLPYNPDPEAPGPPLRNPPPQPPTAMWQEVLNAEGDMKGVAGIFDASLGAQGNETSGRAIVARQQESSTANFIFVDNLALAVEQTGRILVDLIPKIYDTERVVRVLGEDGSERLEKINEAQPGPEGSILKDITKAKYDVRVSVGPSYTTKRQEAADLMLGLAQAYPNITGVAGDLIVKNFDIPGAEDIAERLKKTLPPELLDIDPESEEGQRQMMMAQQQAQMQQIQMEMEMAMRAAEINAKEAEAAKKEAEMLKTQVETMEKSQELVNRDQVMELIELELSRRQDEQQLVEQPGQLLEQVVD